MMYIVKVAFQDYSSDHYEHWVGYSNVAYCASREAAEREIANHLSLKELTTNVAEFREGDKCVSINLFSIVEEKLIY